MADLISGSRCDIEKSFIQPDRNRLVILQNLDLQVEQGSVVSITGASGSGKSTLLHLLGSLDAPDRGQVRFAGRISAPSAASAWPPTATGTSVSFFSSIT